MGLMRGWKTSRGATWAPLLALAPPARVLVCGRWLIVQGRLAAFDYAL